MFGFRKKKKEEQVQEKTKRVAIQVREPWEEHIAASMIGSAIGDTIGMAVEAWKKEQIEHYVGRVTEPMDPIVFYDKRGERIKEDQFGKIKAWTRNLKKGQYTDDTACALAIAESMGTNGLDVKKAAMAQVAAYHDNPDRAYGRTTRDAFANLERGVMHQFAGGRGPGDGPAMKMHPVGIYLYASNDLTGGMWFAEQSGLATHLDPRSIAGGAVQAYATYLAFNNAPRENFLRGIIDACRAHEGPVDERTILPEAGSLGERLQWIYDNRDADVDLGHKVLRSSSLAWEAQPFALFMFQKYMDEPLEGLLNTINYGGDCDTTGAMVGALYGARHGPFWPKEWEQELEDAERIKDAALAVFKTGRRVYAARKWRR